MTVRLDARREIVAAANHARREPSNPLLTMRHLHQAVFRCRQRGLVNAKTLIDAGFNPR